MPYSKDQVYKSENLRFATHEEGRQPTLYFRTSHGSGRLRQEHPSGPKVQDIRMHTSHAFFATKKERDDFAEVFKSGGMSRGDFRSKRSVHGGHHTPFEGAHHFEATFSAHGPGGTALSTHKSGGQVVSTEKLEQLRPKAASIFAQTTHNEAEYKRNKK